MGNNKKLHILLAEDDTNLGFVVQDNLKAMGYEVTLCIDGEQALKTFVNNNFDACILDVMMPKKGGFEVAETIRDINPEIPIIFLTAKSLQPDKVRGFTIGADDYITKPFDFQEFVLRLEAVLRRSNLLTKEENNEVNNHNIGDYELDIKNQLLKHKNNERSLTKKETKILSYLCKHKNDIAPREMILKNIWGNDDYFSGRSMDVFISKLRKYLSDDKKITITNIHGVGFKLEVEN
ncbi:MAG: response regulator transcription factor [Vicingaceae bacterium]|jgi:two-component system, OmpR family, response regulator|nr:response regulator transcription factor [Flavobacteriales bacterium]MBQ21101.1 DNA-binding response regulator [Flavobacteriales bacterium]MDF1675413.1 response regulator transcription factor [Vicingaceae bacterium]|tara:strand:- start:71865 stop:72572 length:708 start_codon:yes stop_codon:yes gene_type:complete